MQIPGPHHPYTKGELIKITILALLIAAAIHLCRP
jgi:hypothetical protein